MKTDFLKSVGLILLLCTMGMPRESIQHVNQELELLNHLMVNYSPSVRPVLNPLDQVIVNISIAIGFIIDLDEKEQVIILCKCGIYLRQKSHLFNRKKTFGRVFLFLLCPDFTDQCKISHSPS